MSSDARDPGIKDRCLRLLGDITSEHGILPTSYYLTEVTVEDAPDKVGFYSDILRGQLDGRKVFVKVFRGDCGYTKFTEDIKRVRNRGPIRSEHTEPDINQSLSRELVAWKHVTHENVVPFLGVSLEVPRWRNNLSIISDVAQHGNIVEYISKNKEVNRLKLVSNLP